MSVRAVPETLSTTVDLAPVALQVASSARAVARARRVLLSAEVESGPLPVPGSWREVHDAVLDLVGQAVSACRAGAVVVLDVHREDGGIAVDVTDTGPDEPSPRVDAPASRLLVESWGGHLSTARVPGVGTSVRLWWPAADGPLRTPLDPGNAGLAAVV